MNTLIEGKEVVSQGSFVRVARLRHEWCDFLVNPIPATREIAAHRVADLFTFVSDITEVPPLVPYHRELIAMAVLPVTTYEQWWEDIGKKKRNQIRKAEKSGVAVRIAALDESFAGGVETIYNESPIRQGRKFCHFGQDAQSILAELSSFLDRSMFVGAYVADEMVGFMKLFKGRHALRIVNILAKLSERDRCVMDALIAKSVELCADNGFGYVQYGSWADSGIGAFRMKHGFRRFEVPRFYVPLTWRGRLMLHLRLHRPIREKLPKNIVDALVDLRARWNSLRVPKGLADA